MMINRVEFNNITPVAQQQPMRFAQTPQFGNAVTKAATTALAEGAGDTALYRLANWVFDLPRTFSQKHIAPRLAKELATTGKASWKTNWLNSIKDSFLTQEFNKRTDFLKHGQILVKPPLGALGVSFYLGILPSRLYAASQRPKVDKGEYLDILIRDVTSIFGFVYLLDPVTRKLAERVEKTRGIQIVSDHPIGKEIYSYAQLDSFYRLTHPNRLLQLVGRPDNHLGITRVLSEVKRNGNVQRLMGENKQFADKFTQFEALMQEMMGNIKRRGFKAGQTEHLKQILNDPQLRDLAKKGYRLVHELENDVQQNIKTSVQGLGKAIKGSFPSMKGMFSSYACRGRLGVDFAAFACVVAFLGIGVTKFNEWLTARRTHTPMHKTEA